MSSTLLDFIFSRLLEWAMDFRENWLAHFVAIVNAEIQAAGGNNRDGYRAVAAKIEKDPETVYQHFNRKSGKVYPTVEMMVAIEKKYGNGRPAGWASLPVKSESQPQWGFDLVDRARYEALSDIAKGAAQTRMMDEIEAQERKTKSLPGNGTDG
jgi:hypothetical protein